MRHVPRFSIIALNIRDAFACRASADSDEHDGFRRSFRHAVIQAVFTFVLILILGSVHTTGAVATRANFSQFEE